MARGGARPGAGRKRKNPYAPLTPSGRDLGMVKAAELKLREALPGLVDVAIGLAREGDRRMLVYCIDRVLGSPVQPIDLEVTRAAERLALAVGADPEFLIRRAQQLAADHSGAKAQ